MSKYIDVKTLKQRINIVDLAITLGVKVVKNRAMCISHSEKHPSMHFDTSKNRFKCFGCGLSGDVIDFYMACQNKNLSESLLDLASTYALDLILDKIPTGRSMKIENNKPSSILRTEVVESFHDVYMTMKKLCENLDTKSLNYLTGPERGLNISTITGHGIFHIPNRDKYNQILEILKGKYGKDKIQRSGINSFYKFAHENIPFIIVPFFVGDKIEYLWARRIDGERNEKSLNLKGRRVPIFNINTLKKINIGDKLYVCEGVFDALIAEQSGDPAIAILGVGSCRPVLLNQIKDYDICLCLDNDQPGKEAIKKTYTYFKNIHGKIITAKKLPDGIKDITDYYLTYKKDQPYD